MRKSNLFFLFLGLQSILVIGTFLHTLQQKQNDTERLDRNTALVRTLGLTDLCLFTEANYTRHPSQADFHAAFQDAPSSLEHFPSGSLLQFPIDARTDAR